jgi:hypothetical protein
MSRYGLFVVRLKQTQYRFASFATRIYRKEALSWQELDDSFI